LEGAFSDNDLTHLRVERRRLVDAHQEAVKRFERVYSTGRHFEECARYLLRPGDEGNAWGQRFLVKETFAPDDKNMKFPIHQTLGRIWLDDTAKTPMCVASSTASEKDVEELMALYKWFGERFNECIGRFPARILRARLGRLLSDCLPIAMDADHRFMFVHRDRKKAIELLSAAIKFLGGRAGDVSRCERSDISVLPLPDLAEMREAVAKAYSDDVRDMVASVRKTAEEFVGNEGFGRPADLIAAMERLSTVYRTIDKYRTDLGAIDTNLQASLDDVRTQVSVLLGQKDSKFTPWQQAAKRMSVLALQAGEALMRVFDTTPRVRSDSRAISWSFGADNKPLLVMSDVLNPVAITVTCPGEMPDSENSAWKKGLTGASRTFNGEDFARIVVPWWTALAPKGGQGKLEVE